MVSQQKMFRRYSCSGTLISGWLLASCASAPQSSADATPPFSAALEVSPPGAVASEPVVTDLAGDSLALPRGLTSFGAASSSGGQLYIFGGYFGSPHAYSKAEQSDELLRLDIATGAWQKLGTSEHAQGVALVAHGDRLVRIGGMQATNEQGTPAVLQSLATVEAFDTATSTWSRLEPLPEPRSSHDAIVVGDTVWVIGGWTLDGEDKIWHDTLLRMDLGDESPRWVETPIPFRRRALAVAEARGQIVVLGGITDEGELSSAVDLYDPQADSWSSGPKFPGKGFGMAAASQGDAIYASGMEGVVYRWSPGETDWARMTSLAYPRFFHRIVPSSAEELLVVGGIRGMRSGIRVRPIERISTLAQPTEVTVLAYELKSPLPSKNRQGVALVGDTLLMFGGNQSLGQHDFKPEFFTDVGYGLNLASMRWHAMAPYPVRRQSMSTFTKPNGEVISVAGFGYDGTVSRSHPEIFAYDPENDQWKPAGTLPGQGRSQFGLAVRDNEVVVFGGLNFDPKRPEKDQFRHELPLLEARAGEPELAFETSDLELQRPRRAFAGALMDDTYYLVGGMQDGFAMVDSCEAYDFPKASWKTIACPQRTRLSAQMVALNGKLYLAAGSSKGNDGQLAPDPALEVYDPATDVWTTVIEQLPIQSRNMRMLQYGDRLLLISTHNDEGKVHVVLISP